MSTQISKRELLRKHALSAGVGVGALALLPQRASADTPFTSFPFTATGAPTPRTMPDRLGEIKNVKDYGALGDGVTDDTDAIQACFDAAYSNGLNWKSNRPVFFPSGFYRITRPVYITNSGGVYLFGAERLTTKLINDGTTAAGSFVGHIDPQLSGTVPDPNQSGILTVTKVNSGRLYVGSIISGGTIIDGTTICSMEAGTTGGLGTYRVLTQTAASTTFTSTNDTALYLNGCMYSTFRNFSTQGAANGVGLDYDWGRELADVNGGQLNLFESVTFAGAYGCRVGFSGAQCDTSTWVNCLFGGVIAGILVCNQNAVAHNIYGGNFQSCGIGIHATGGFVNAICGCGFQLSSVCDIRLEGGAGVATFIAGIDSESTNFLWVQAAEAAFKVSAVGHRGTGVNGYFLRGGHGTPVNIDSCYSKSGNILGSQPLTIANSAFNRLDALDSYDAGPAQRLVIRDSYIGDNVYGLAHRIEHRVIGAGGAKRNHDIEAASLTDPAFLYDSWSAGGDRPYDILGSISHASPAVCTGSACRFLTGTAIAFTTTGTLPAPLAVGKTYYVIPVTANSYRVAATPSGAAINTTTGGSGTHRVWLVRRYEKGDQVLNNNVTAAGSPGWICTTAGYSLDDAGTPRTAAVLTVRTM